MKLPDRNNVLNRIKGILRIVFLFFARLFIKLVDFVDDQMDGRLSKNNKQIRHFSYDELPTSRQLGEELQNQRYLRRYKSIFRSTVSTLITVAAVAILVATLMLPVLQIYGSSMTPTLVEGDLVVSLKGSKFETGDVVAFYYNNKILVKRVIANPGQWVDIDKQGNVFVDSRKIDEPYVKEKALGDCNIKLPYQVPDGKIFVLGDHRSVSIDSRNKSVGCVAEEQIVGKLAFCIWPIRSAGIVK